MINEVVGVTGPVGERTRRASSRRRLTYRTRRNVAQSTPGAKPRTLLRFLVVGAVSFVVNEGLLLVLHEWVFDSVRGRGPLGLIDPALLLASLIALEASIIVRFVLNDRWTFSGRDGKPLTQRLWQSHLSSFGSPLLCLVTVNLLPGVIGISYLVANSFGVLLGLVWNWVWSTRVVWSVQASPEQLRSVLP